MNRRQFLVQVGAAGALLSLRARGDTSAASVSGIEVALVIDPSDDGMRTAATRWAVNTLHAALRSCGFEVRRVGALGDAPRRARCIAIGSRGLPLAREAGVTPSSTSESLTIGVRRIGERDVLLAVGADERGLVYALTELAEQFTSGADPLAPFQLGPLTSETPANRVRSVMRLFASDVEDKAWYHDRGFWERYFNFLVAQRFNRFNLALGLGYDQPVGLTDTYFYFAYPFLVSVPGYNVRATGLPEAERDRNLEMLRFISDAAVARGLEFQLGLWTHAYRWVDSPHANHRIEGLTPETQAPYSRDALALLLKECPNISGVTLRIHGESGVPEGSYGLWGTIFEGAVRSGRQVRLDLHAKGMDQPTLDAAVRTGLPLTLSPKFWAEHLGLPYHQAAIRPNEMPSGKPGVGPFAQSEGARSFLRYGYGDLLREDRRYSVVTRIWSGTQRVLLWSDPTFGAAYSRAMQFCGMDGCEIFEPLAFKGRKGSGLPGGREGYGDATLRAAGDDFEKYCLTYRTWGRLLYNPAASAVVFDRQLQCEFGPNAAAPAGAALARASRILPLLTTAHDPSAANNHFWPEMYVNMAMADPTAPVMPYPDTPEPRRFTNVSPLDPQLFSRTEEFVDDALAGRTRGKYTPLEVAQWLDDLARAAATALADATGRVTDAQTPAFRRFAIDTEVLIGLGQFFAEKFRAGVCFALFLRTGNATARAKATAHYRRARDRWARISRITTGVYAHDVTYGEAWYQRGHWVDRLPAIDRDIAAVEQAPPPARAVNLSESDAAALLRHFEIPPERCARPVEHTPPSAFQRGAELRLRFELRDNSEAPKALTLLYRHVNQSELWSSAKAERDGAGFIAVIPAAYTDSPYPLQYYVAGEETNGAAWLYPGLGDLTRQPYFAVCSATPTGKESHLLS